MFALSFSACGDDEDDISVLPTSFTVTIENISTPGTINTMRANGINPMSPPVWALYSGDNPMFTVGEEASDGTEGVAEDGAFDELVSELTSDSSVKASGAVPSPGGPDMGGALFQGESITFTFVAEPGDKLQFESMFVQSNDWFYAFGNGGLELFDNGNAISGDFTNQVVVYDAGTEADTAPGTGPDQKPVQATDDQGPEDSVDMIQNARTRFPNFTIPPNNQLLRVTVTPAG